MPIGVLAHLVQAVLSAILWFFLHLNGADIAAAIGQFYVFFGAALRQRLGRENLYRDVLTRQKPMGSEVGNSVVQKRHSKSSS